MAEYEKYVKEKPSLDDYKCDQTIIIDRTYLKHIYGLNYQDHADESVTCRKRYPFTNSYYRHTEYVDAFKRVTHLLDCKYFLESSSIDLLVREKPKVKKDPYSEKDAHIQYLSDNPLSFLILGKPGMGEQNLGKLLAEHWNCVYIDPQVLIKEEIKSDSSAGKCIDYNLRSGRAIGVDVILRLIEKRVRSKTAQHRGFVICGFPLIPNDLYEEDPISSESALFNVKDIFGEILDEALKFPTPVSGSTGPKSVKFMPVMEDADDDDDYDNDEILSTSSTDLSIQKSESLGDKDMGTLLGSVCVPPQLDKNFEEQLDFIFNLFTAPFQIIYVACDNADVISRHNSNKFDVRYNIYVNQQEEKLDQLFFQEMFFPSNDEEIPEDIAATVKYNLVNPKPKISQYLVTLPNDFPANVAVQLDRFYVSAMPIMECYILAHDPEYYLKLDGTLTSVVNFNTIKTRIQVMPFQKVIIPKKILPDKDDEFFGEDIPEKIEEDFTDMEAEEVYNDFRKREIVAPLFKWSWSDWISKCPVSMKEADSKDGIPECAVHFLNKIFFLSSSDALLKFTRNPRPYLLPPYPKSSCRIFVMGPRSSGKTAVSQCLAYLLNGVVIFPGKLIADLKSKKHQEHMEQVKEEALYEGIRLLNEQREQEYEEAETLRLDEIDVWKAAMEPLLVGLMEYHDILPKEETETGLENVSSFALKMTKSTDDKRLREMERIKDKIMEYEKQLAEMNLPTTYSECQALIENKELLLNYLPDELKFPEKLPIQATVLDPFVINYAKKVLENTEYVDFEIGEHEAFNIYATAIKEIENQLESMGNCRGGWIIDGLSMNLALLDLLYPNFIADDVYILKDEPDHKFLTQRFETRGANNFRQFREFFMDIGKIDAAWRSPSTKSTDSYKAQMAHYILDEILDNVQIIGEVEGESDEKFKDDYFKKHPRRAEASEYARHLKEFDSKIQSVLEFFESVKVPVYELSVTDKSLENLLMDAIKCIENRFRVQATQMTQEEREEELNDIIGPVTEEGEGEEMGEEEEAKEGEKEDPEVLFRNNRRYGNTFWFCPYAFKNYFVLWKGKEENAVKFNDKVYLLSSEEVMEKFIEDPRKYLILQDPPVRYPPPRICIVGPSYSGRTTLARALSKNYGLFNVSYQKIIKNIAPPRFDLELMGEQVEEEEEIEKDNTERIEEYERTEIFENVKKRWHTEPFKTFGFVMDGYPISIQDGENMLDNYLIPDLILFVNTNESEVHKRLIEFRVEQWRIDRFESVRLQNEEIIRDWEKKREKRINELMVQRRELRYITKTREIEGRDFDENEIDAKESADNETEDAKSQISYNSVDEQEDMDIVLRIIAEELSEPVLVDEPQETLEEIIDIVTHNIVDLYREEIQALSTIKELFENELIPWVNVNGDDTPDKVFAQAVKASEEIKLRNESLFERTYDISLETAEKLLQEGYYLLSQFGKSCPVQIYEELNTIQLFLPLEEKFKVYPVIYRNNIYFLAGIRNRDLFKNNPLKYIKKKDIRFPLIPFKVGVIGPPMSGKTTLASRFNKDLGLKLITRGKAIRYVLKYLPHSKLFQDVEEELRKGDVLSDDLVIKCVNAMAMDGKSSTQGFVLDGFPERIEEVNEMIKYQLLPQVAFDLMADEEKMLEYLQDNIPPPGVMPCNYSESFMKYRFEMWNINQQIFRKWLTREYQIVANLEVNKTKWGIWKDALEIAMSVLYEVKNYYKSSGRDVVLHLANMQVSPLEFLERRRKRYSSYCPCCLYYEDALVTGGEPPDRTGLVQYKEFFYWLCQNHMQEFKDNPTKFLPPYNSKSIPEDRPEIIDFAVTREDCHLGGICVVCYWNNLPKKVVVYGFFDYCVRYKDRFYLFDKVECMKEFTKYPVKYFSKTVVPSVQELFSFEAKNLPIIGYLEQFTAADIISGLKAVSRLRPFVPGLSISTSACVYLGLYLKINNRKLPSKFREKYGTALDILNERRNKFKNYLSTMKNQRNPYVYYEEPIPKFVDPILDKPLHPAITRKRVEPKPQIVEEFLGESIMSSFTGSAQRLLDEILNNIDYGSGSLEGTEE